MLEVGFRKSLIAFLFVFVAGAGGLTVAGCSGGNGGGDPLDHLVVAPDGATIDTQTTVQIRATGVTRSGRMVPVSGVEWEASSGTVSGEEFSSTTEGDAVLTATAEGVEGSGTIHVVAPGSMDLLVVDAATGTAIQGAFVSLVSTTGGSAVTAGDGTASVTNAAVSGPIDLSVRATNYHPVTLYGVKVRDARIPMRPVDPPAPGSFKGVIDFQEAYDRNDPPSGSLWVGVAGPSIKGNLLSFGFETLLGPDRSITIAGLTVDAPSNVFVYGITADYEAPAPAGATAAWALGGEVTLQEITDIASNTGSSDLGTILAEAIPIFSRFYYAIESGLTVQANQTLSGIDLVLDTKLARTAKLAIPPRPVTDPNPLLVAAADLGEEGLVPVGLAVVDGDAALSAEMKVAPLDDAAFTDSSYVFLSVAQEGGTGSGSADQQIAVLERGVQDVGNVEFPDFFVPPAVSAFTSDAATRTFDFPTTTGAAFTFHTFSRTVVSGSGANAVETTYEWDVAAGAEATGFVLPALAGTHGAMAGGNWTVQTLGLESRTYESLLAPSSTVDLGTYFNDADRIVITRKDVN